MIFSHCFMRRVRLAGFFSIGVFAQCISVSDGQPGTVLTEDMAAPDPGAVDLQMSAEPPLDLAQSRDLRLNLSDFDVPPNDQAPANPCLQVAAATAYRPALMRVNAGTFLMGSAPQDPGHQADETQHRVTITKSYYMAETEITQLQFKNVRGYYSFDARGDDLPTQNILWLEAVYYSNELSAREGRSYCYLVNINSMTGAWAVSVNTSCSGYRLPTEAEWEMAARAGQPTTYAGGDNANVVATYVANSSGVPTPVKSRLPNALCIYDLSGNVDEWVEDSYKPDYGGLGDVTDPRGLMTSAQNAVLRGGNFENIASWLRVAIRDKAVPNIVSRDVGFRVVRTAD